MRIELMTVLLGLVLTSCTQPAQNQISAADNVTTDDMTTDNMTPVDDLMGEVNNAQPKSIPSITSSEPATAWSYQEKKDEMRGSTIKLASVSAAEAIHLSAPYGDTTPELKVRRDPKFGFDIYMSSEGQPLCQSYEDDTISVKFDDERVHEWACNEAADGSPGIIFIRRAEAFLAQLKKAKKVTLEVNYYDAGREQITFPVAGLKW